MAVAMVLAVALSLFLFVALPSGMATLVGKGTDSRFVINLSAGLTRIAILIGYMIAMSFVPDIKRVFMYHGAEHKTVYCNEAGLELTPENARRFSRLHPRCGTAFLFLVMFISILIGAVADQVLFALFGIEKLTFLGRILRSLLTLPIVTGVSYEVLKGLAHAGDSVIVRILRWPGMMLQYLTTREPDDSMLEVAIASMKAAKAVLRTTARTLTQRIRLRRERGKSPNRRATDRRTKTRLTKRGKTKKNRKRSRKRSRKRRRRERREEGRCFRVTIREALRLAEARLEQAGVPDADVDAAYLLASVLKEDTLAMRINGHRELAAPQRAAFDALCDRRAAREPLQYILGETEFMGLTFHVEPGVLIPRADTEILVEKALECMKPGARVLDIGTGSGAIAVSLAKLGRQAQVTAVDVSDRALEIARRNAERNGAAVEFVKSDCFSALKGRKYDMIVSNPPYISEDEMRGLMPAGHAQSRSWRFSAARTGLIFTGASAGKRRNT